jgi:hypothetical protein
VREIERKFPFLNEELRTAADNLNMENPVVQELHEEILEKIKKVDVGSFFDSKKTSSRVLFAVMLCFAVLFVATFNMNFDFKIMVENMPNYVYVGGGDSGQGDKASGDVRTAGSGGSEDILGEQDVAALGNEQLNIDIKQSGLEINLNDVEKPRKRYFQDLYPSDICINDKSCRQAETYGDQLTKEQSEIVKSYFTKITS